MSVAIDPIDPLPSRLAYLPRLARLLFQFDKKTAMWLSLLNTSMGLFATVEVYIIYRLIDAAQAVVRQEIPLIVGIMWAGAVFGFHVLRASLGTTTQVIGDRFQESLRGHIEEACYRQAQSLPLNDLESPDCHDQLERARRGTEDRLFSTMAFLWQNIGNVVALATLLVFLGTFHWGLPLLLAIGTTPGVLIRAGVHKQRYLLHRKQTPGQRRFNAYHYMLTGRESAKEVRAFGFGPWLIDQTVSLWRALARERIGLARTEARLTFLSDSLNAIVYVLSLIASVAMLLMGRATISAYAAFFYAIESFQDHYWSLIWNGAIIYNDLQYFQDFFDFVDRPTVNQDEGLRLPTAFGEAITFENVSFTYPGSTHPALSNVSFSIKLGERIALVGENGAGKSTLVKLLMGLYKVSVKLSPPSHRCLPMVS